MKLEVMPHVADAFLPTLMAIVGAGLGNLILFSIIRERRALYARKIKTISRTRTLMRYIAFSSLKVNSIMKSRLIVRSQNILKKFHEFKDIVGGKPLDDLVSLVLPALANVLENLRGFMLVSFALRQISIFISHQFGRMFGFVFLLLFPGKKA